MWRSTRGLRPFVLDRIPAKSLYNRRLRRKAAAFQTALRAEKRGIGKPVTAEIPLRANQPDQQLFAVRSPADYHLLGLIDEIDLTMERGLSVRGDIDRVTQQRNVLCLQCVPA